jgi:hypothetical protein
LDLRLASRGLHLRYLGVQQMIAADCVSSYGDAVSSDGRSLHLTAVAGSVQSPEDCWRMKM